MSPFGVGVVGAGLSGRSHTLDIVTDPGMDLVGVVGGPGGSAMDFAELFDCAVYSNLSDLLGRCDGVVVAVPPVVVFDILEEVVASGTPCLVEKPVAVAPRDRHRLAELAMTAAPVVAPFNRRYQHAAQLAAAVIAGGELGRVLEVNAKWVGPFRERFAPAARTYRAKAGARHGVLVDSGSHALDLVMQLVGDLEVELTDVWMHRNHTGAEVEARVTMRHRSGARITLTMDDFGSTDTAAACVGERWECAVRCEGGQFTLDQGGMCSTDMSLSASFSPAKPDTDRPITDLLRLGGVLPTRPAGARLPDVLQLSDVLIEAFEHARAGRRWSRPRGKALGRLNGAC